jgi:hypothetical protein
MLDFGWEEEREREMTLWEKKREEKRKRWSPVYSNFISFYLVLPMKLPQKY